MNRLQIGLVYYEPDILMCLFLSPQYSDSMSIAERRSHTSSPKYRPDIDGLRALAVLAVVAFHAFPNWIKGGFIGVDVFFVISGYLITTIILEGMDKGNFSFTDFYVRRINRIFPALIIVLVSCVCFGWFSLLADEYKQLGKHIVAGASFISNLIFWREAGYFDNSADTKPLLHLWSLGVEEQFYIIWPLLVWLAWKRKFNLATVIIFLYVFSFIVNVVEIEADSVGTFYSPLTRFWELSTGSFLSYLTVYGHFSSDNFSKLKSNIISSLGFSTLIISMFLMGKDLLFPGWWAVPPVLGASLLIAAGSKSFVNSTILSNKLTIWFGVISFPLYLWHWPLLSYARIVEVESPARAIRVVLVLTSILLAWATYELVEKRIRFSKDYRWSLMLVFSSISVATAGAYIYLSDGLGQRSAIKGSGLTEQVRGQFTGPLWQYTKNDNCLNRYPFKDAAKAAWWFCMKSDKAEPTLIILGTSFANQLYPGFASNPALKHHSVLSIGTCDFGGDETTDLDVTKPCFGKRGTDQRQFIDNIILDSKSIRFAIIDGLSRRPDQSYIKRVQKRISRYELQGIHVIIFTPHISPNFHPKACFTTPLRSTVKDCTFPATDRQRLFDDFMPLIESLKKTNPKTLVFEQNQIFCEKAECSYLRDGMPLNRDEVHTSEYESVGLQHYFTAWAKIYLPQIFDANVPN